MGRYTSCRAFLFMEQSWILVGMMGSGKSTVGRDLAKLADRAFFDTDILLQNRFGRTVSQIFECYGEDAFRGHETSILKGLQPGPSVISTGGGIVMREENWTEMKRLGLVIFLDVPPDRLVERLAKSRKKRPLLEIEDWELRVHELYKTRLPMYQRADLAHLTSRDWSSEVAEELLVKIQEHLA